MPVANTPTLELNGSLQPGNTMVVASASHGKGHRVSCAGVTVEKPVIASR